MITPIPYLKADTLHDVTFKHPFSKYDILAHEGGYDDEHIRQANDPQTVSIRARIKYPVFKDRPLYQVLSEIMHLLKSTDSALIANRWIEELMILKYQKSIKMNAMHLSVPKGSELPYGGAVVLKYSPNSDWILKALESFTDKMTESGLFEFWLDEALSDARKLMTGRNHKNDFLEFNEIQARSIAGIAINYAALSAVSV